VLGVEPVATGIDAAELAQRAQRLRDRRSAISATALEAWLVEQQLAVVVDGRARRDHVLVPPGGEGLVGLRLN
jgi:hypothetical protein